MSFVIEGMRALLVKMPFFSAIPSVPNQTPVGFGNLFRSVETGDDRPEMGKKATDFQTFVGSESEIF
jgi:hypothetical protein